MVITLSLPWSSESSSLKLLHFIFLFWNYLVGMFIGLSLIKFMLFFFLFLFYYIKNPQKKQEPSVPKRVFSVFICGAFIFPLEELKLCTWFIMFLSHCFISGVSQRQTRVFNVVQGRLHTSKPLHNHSTESNQICTFPFLRTQVMHLLFILW